MKTLLAILFLVISSCGHGRTTKPSIDIDSETINRLESLYFSGDIENLKMEYLGLASKFPDNSYLKSIKMRLVFHENWSIDSLNRYYDEEVYPILNEKYILSALATCYYLAGDRTQSVIFQLQASSHSESTLPLMFYVNGYYLFMDKLDIISAKRIIDHGIKVYPESNYLAFLSFHLEMVKISLSNAKLLLSRRAISISEAEKFVLLLASQKNNSEKNEMTEKSKVFFSVYDSLSSKDIDLRDMAHLCLLEDYVELGLLSEYGRYFLNNLITLNLKYNTPVSNYTLGLYYKHTDPQKAVIYFENALVMNPSISFFNEYFDLLIKLGYNEKTKQAIIFACSNNIWIQDACERAKINKNMCDSLCNVSSLLDEKGMFRW